MVQEYLGSKMESFKLQGGEEVIQGGAIGVDQWSALAALEAGLSLRSYLPFPEQGERWPRDAQERLEWIKGQSSEVKIFGDSFAMRHFFVRNQAIVDDCSILLAVRSFEEQVDGGTIHARDYAMKTLVPVIEAIVYLDRIEEKYREPQGLL